MYYNLKIKSQDSEFCLDSNNKEIISREMDLYFANILGVSTDFLENIKKVEVKSKEVKSISVLDNPNSIIKPKNIDIENDIEQRCNNPVVKEFINGVQVNHQNASGSLLFKNDKVEETVVEIDSTFEDKKQANFLDRQINDYQIIKSIGSKEEIKEPKIHYSDFSFQVEKNLLERQNNIERLVSLAQSKVDNMTFEEENDLVSFDKFARSIDNSPSFIDDIDSTVTNLEPDFRAYLSKCNVKNIDEEFLVCAYYIKHVLRLESFTMKFINSRLFQATGKIADMTTVNQLIAKYYLKLYGMGDAKIYTITPEGEKYFATQLKI